MGNALADSFPGVVGVAVRALSRASAVMAARRGTLALVPAVEAAIADEVRSAFDALGRGDLERAEYHAGRIHILGSYFFVPHGFSHAVHLRICIARNDLRGALIQIVRLAGTRAAVSLPHSSARPATPVRRIGPSDRAGRSRPIYND